MFPSLLGQDSLLDGQVLFPISCPLIFLFFPDSLSFLFSLYLFLSHVHTEKRHPNVHARTHSSFPLPSVLSTLPVLVPLQDARAHTAVTRRTLGAITTRITVYNRRTINNTTKHVRLDIITSLEYKRYEKRRDSASPRPRNEQSYVSAHLCLWRLGSSIWRLFRSLGNARVYRHLASGLVSNGSDDDTQTACTTATREHDRLRSSLAR